MAAVSDVLVTRLELAGLAQWSNGMGQAAAALGLVHDELDSINQIKLTKAFGAGAASIGIMAALARATQEAAAEQETYNNTLRNFKGRLAASDLQQFTGALSDLTGVDDGRIAEIVGQLGTFQISPQAAMGLTEPILNAQVALRALGVDSVQIANMVGKALESGDAAGLRRTGVLLDVTQFKAASAAQRVEMLQEALNAQGGANAAREFRKSFEGAEQALGTAIGNLRENAGAPFVKPFTDGINQIADGVNALNNLPAGAFQTFGAMALVGAGAMTVYALKTGASVVKAQSLAGENATLTNELLKSAKAADKSGDEESETATQMGVAEQAAIGLTGKLGPLATAHYRAAQAANAHADAEGRAAREMGYQPQGKRTVAGRSRAQGGRSVSRALSPVVVEEVRTANAKRSAPKGGTVTTGGMARGERQSRSSAGSKASGLPTTSKQWWQSWPGAPKNTTVAPSAGTAGQVVKNAGRFAKVAKFAKGAKFGSPLAIAADFGAQFALNSIPEETEGPTGTLKRYGTAALEGGNVGALAGSVIPGIGQLTGGVIGALVGAGSLAVGDLASGDGKATSQLTDRVNPQAVAAAKAARDGGGSEELLAEMQRQTALLDEIRRSGKGVVSTSEIPLISQRGAIGGRRII